MSQMKRPNFNALYRVGDIVKSNISGHIGMVIEVLVSKSLDSCAYVIEYVDGNDAEIYTEGDLSLVKSYDDIKRVVDQYGE